MTLHCTSRHADGTPCQEQDPRHTVHHAHDDTGAQCLQWVDAGDPETRIPEVCDWRKIHDAVFRGTGPAAEIKARRARLTAVAVEHTDDELLHAEIERLRYEETRATDNDFGTHPPHEQLIAGTYTPDWEAIRAAQQHLGAVDPDLIVAVQNLWAQNTARGVEIERLRVELAKSRRDALFEASEIAGSVQAETSADKALRATIVAKPCRSHGRRQVREVRAPPRRPPAPRRDLQGPPVRHHPLRMPPVRLRGRHHHAEGGLNDGVPYRVLCPRGL